MSQSSGPRAKRDTRGQALARRDALTADQRADASARIAEVTIELLARRLPSDRSARTATIAMYSSKSSEVDTARLDALARARSWTVVYPRVTGDARALAFHAATPGELVPARLGLREPVATAPAVELTSIDAFIVPGAAFDRAGNRVGWGRGHYDATLAGAPNALRVGVAFDCQVVDKVTVEAHDMPLHAIVTERGAIEVT